MSDSTLIQSILERLRSLSSPARPIYVVGGAVRDIFLQRDIHDLDFVLPGSTRPVARLIADAFGGGFYVLDEVRDTSRVVLQPKGGARLVLDFASIRGESLEDDLRGRDFTLNAMAYHVSDPERLIDPLGGLADLRARLLRACAPTSLEQDPARVLRAVRQALSLKFRIEPGTLQLAHAAVPLLRNISPERQRDELFRILAGRKISQAVQILDHLGVLEVVLPELLTLKGVRQSAPHVSNVWEHTLGVVNHLEYLFDALVGDYNEDASADLMNGLAVMRLGRYRANFARHFETELQPDRPARALLFFAALYHDIAKPVTRTEEPDGKTRFLTHPEKGTALVARRARALVLSGDEVEYIERVVRQHMRVHFLANDLLPESCAEQDQSRPSPTRRSIYRYFRDTGEAGIDICLLSLADMRATYETTLTPQAWLVELDACRALLEAYWENNAEVVSPPRLLNGREVIEAFGLKPGPQIGKLLDAVRERQATGHISSREEALDFARLWVKRLGTNQERQEG